MTHVDDAVEHVGYEWWMFKETFDLLDALPDDPDVVRNALLESLAIHGRNLGHFFFEYHKCQDGGFNADDAGIGLGLSPSDPISSPSPVTARAI
jgi:hypothetical protein